MRYVDPTGHICVQNGGGLNEFAMAGNCNGEPKPNYDPSKLLTPLRWTPKSQPTTGGGEGGLLGGASGGSGEGGGGFNNEQDRAGKVDFVSASVGISIPSVMILTGGLLCLSTATCVVGYPIATTGMTLVKTPANAFSLGPVFTLDSYGNIYFGMQGAVGKTVPGVPLGFEIVGYKINSSPDYVSGSETRDFITQWNVAVNSIGFPGMSGFRIPPTGTSLNPTTGQTATSGTYIGSVLAEASISYTWELPFNIGDPESPSPWVLP